MTRRETWAAVVVLAVVVVFYALFPRYQITVQSPRVFRVDRWTGHVEAASVGALRYASWADVVDAHVAKVSDIVDVVEPPPAR